MGKKSETIKVRDISNLNSELNLSLPIPKAAPVIIIFSSLFLILLIAAVGVQIVNGSESLRQAENLVISERYFQPERGIFKDRDGEILVENIEKYDLYLSVKEKEELDIYVSKLANLGISIDKAALEKNLEASLELKAATNLDVKKALEVGDVLEDGDFYYKIGFKRNYLYPLQFSNILGYTGEVDQEDVASGEYALGDQVGKYKLELQLEDNLKGEKGKTVFNQGVEVLYEGVPGNNVTLTIDSDWQRYLYKFIDEYNKNVGSPYGSAVVMNTETGEVAALVSTPGFNTNEFVNGISADSLDYLQNSRSKPLIDKAIASSAPPGSTFKLITAYTLLQNGTVNRDTNFFSNRCMKIGAVDFCEFRKYFYGNMNPERAIYKSSNMFFCNYLLDYENAHGIGGFVEDGKNFGIGEATGIDLPGEVEGNMDSPEYKSEVFNLGWFAGDTCNAAIGQGSILETPIQMATRTAAIYNGGELLKPAIIKRIQDFEGKDVYNFEKEIRRKIEFETETKDIILSGMYNVVHNPDGSVYSILRNTPGNLRVKTGSAEAVEFIDGVKYEGVHGWVTGLFDYEGDTYSFSLFINFGGGGYYISPIVDKFLNCVHDSNLNYCK